MLTERERLYAKLASVSYQKSESPDFVDSYQCDRTFGQANSSVYYSPEFQEVVLAVRGTDLKNPQDLVSDIHIAKFSEGLFSSLGKTDRFRSLEVRMKEIFSKYPWQRIVLCGHSLGGSLCQLLLVKFNKKVSAAYVFNPGTSFGQVLRNFSQRLFGTRESKILKSKLHIFRIGGDPISFLSSMISSTRNSSQSRRSLVNPLINHSVDNFLVGGSFSQRKKNIRNNKKHTMSTCQYILSKTGEKCGVNCRSDPNFCYRHKSSQQAKRLSDPNSVQQPVAKSVAKPKVKKSSENVPQNVPENIPEISKQIVERVMQKVPQKVAKKPSQKKVHMDEPVVIERPQEIQQNVQQVRSKVGRKPVTKSVAKQRVQLQSLDSDDDLFSQIQRDSE